MRPDGKHLNPYRKKHPLLGKSEPDALYGYYCLPSPVDGAILAVISGGERRNDSADLTAWEHVSVSLSDRCPTWEEMSYIKGLFWKRRETVVQFHPSEENYINVHLYCLHLWCDTLDGHSLPPEWCV